LNRLDSSTEEFKRNIAKVAQLVERDLAKVEVAGSNPVFRSKGCPKGSLFNLVKYQDAPVVELVDTQDLKSCVHCGRTGSSPVWGTK
jgi:hypothetical protein